MGKLDLHYGGPGWRERVQDHIVRITVDWEPKRWVGEKQFQDLFGSRWQEGEPAHVIEPALPEPTLQNYILPSFVPSLLTSISADQSRHTILPLLSYADTRQRLQQEKGSALTVVGYGSALFERAWMARGYENFFTDLLLEPDFAAGLLDLILERQLELLHELLKLPCDGIIFCDDYGDQKGVNIGPALWRKFVKPRLAKLYAKTHASGRLVFHHSCGNVFDLVPDLIEIGLDVLQSLQPEAMDVYGLKETFGPHVRLWGGLGTQRLLPSDSPAEIRAEVRRLKGELGRGGGYVFSSSKPIMRDVPVENAVAMIEEMLAE